MLENVKLKLQQVERPKVEGGFKTVFYGIFLHFIEKKNKLKMCVFLFACLGILTIS